MVSAIINHVKTGWILLAGFLFLPFSPAAQPILFSDSLDVYNSGAYYEIIGTIKENPLILRTLPERRYAELIRLDAACRLIEVKTLYFLPLDHLIRKEVFSGKDYWDMVWQVASQNKYFVYLQRLDEAGNPVQPLIVLDSLDRNDSLRKGLPFKIVASENIDQYLSYTSLFLPQEEQLAIHLRKTNILTSESVTALVKIPFQKGIDKLTRPYLDSSGNVYFAKHDEPLNYKLGCRLALYTMTANGGMENFEEIYLKDKKPAEFMFSRHGGRLYLGSLFADFYSQRIQGLVSLSLDLQQRQWDSARFHIFSEDLQKQIRKGYFGIPTKELMNRLSLQDFEYDGDQGFSYLINLAHTEYKNSGAEAFFSKDSLNKSRNDNAPEQAQYMAGNSGRRGRGNRGGSIGQNQNMGLGPSNMSRSPWQSQLLPTVKIANPVVYKTFYAKLDPDLQAIQCRFFKSIALPGMDMGSPLAALQERALVRFSYEMEKEKLSLRAFRRDVQLGEKETEIQQSPQRVLLLENAVIDVNGKWMLAFFRDQQNNGFGLAKWAWKPGQD